MAVGVTLPSVSPIIREVKTKRASIAARARSARCRSADDGNSLLARLRNVSIGLRQLVQKINVQRQATPARVAGD